MTNHTSRVLISLLLLLCTSYSHAAEQVKDWNFLVFLNGVNSLDSFATINLNQMEQVGSNDKMNILVQWGSEETQEVKRLYIKKDDDTTNVTSPVVQSLGTADMGDYKELVRFVDWANTNYPAKHYFIAVWDHGNGWHFTNATGTHIQDISWDDHTGHNFTTEQLGLAMAESAKIIGHKVDIYGSDACMMGMVEVASEVRESVDYFVGSQDTEPGAGWDYNTFLGQWQAAANPTAKDISILLAKTYKSAYDGGIYGKRPVTMAAYDMSQISNYEQAFKTLGQSLNKLSNADTTKAAKAASNTKYFTNWDYRDALDFLVQLEKNGIKSPAFAAVRTAQSQFVLANEQTQDKSTFGVSVWLPTEESDYDNYSDRYKNMKFNQSSDWLSFLKKMMKK